jgi:hypothetical protein
MNVFDEEIYGLRRLTSIWSFYRWLFRRNGCVTLTFETLSARAHERARSQGGGDKRVVRCSAWANESRATFRNLCLRTVVRNSDANIIADTM